MNYYGDDGGGGSGSVSLSIAAIIGIVVGVLGGITLITALVVWIVVQRRRGEKLFWFWFCLLFYQFFKSVHACALLTQDLLFFYHKKLFDHFP